MNKNILDNFKHPLTLEKLHLSETTSNGDVIINGFLEDDQGERFEISDGIPDFTWPKKLIEIDSETRATYDKLALEYDKFANIPFETFKCSNHEIRELITSKLNLKSTDKVLEVGGGDGRGAEYILKFITQGELYFQELSPSFLNQAVKRLTEFSNINYSLGNASYLPFEDNSFDCAHHFGGISTFAEKERCLEELCRVVKPGGKIVIGDEGIGTWLRNTEMAKIMINSNPLIGIEVPISSIPVSARNVNVSWIMMGAFYIIDFEVGEGEPLPNYHIQIPSERGGTHWSRYFGNLEGITDETKKIAKKISKEEGLSMHDWLEKLITNYKKIMP